MNRIVSFSVLRRTAMAILLLPIIAAELHAQSDVARTRETEGLHGPVRRVEYFVDNPYVWNSRVPYETYHFVQVFDTLGRLVEESADPRGTHESMGWLKVYSYDNVGLLTGLDSSFLQGTFDVIRHKGRSKIVHRVDTSRREHFSYRYQLDSHGHVAHLTEWDSGDPERPISRALFTYDEAGRPASAIRTWQMTGTRRETHWERGADSTVTTTYSMNGTDKSVLTRREVCDPAGGCTVRSVFDPGQSVVWDRGPVVSVEEFKDGRPVAVRYTVGTGEPKEERDDYILDAYGNWTVRRRAGSGTGMAPAQRRTITYENVNRRMRKAGSNRHKQ